MAKYADLLFVAIHISRNLFAQANQEIRPPVAAQSVEPESAGGESHSDQIHLMAGRFWLEQRAIDAPLTLTAPGGKQPVEMNLTGANEQESLSIAACTARPLVRITNSHRSKRFASHARRASHTRSQVH